MRGCRGIDWAVCNLWSVVEAGWYFIDWVLQAEGRHTAGSLVPDSSSATHHMWQEYTDQGLYRQLFHFRRQLDVQRALNKIPDPTQRDQAATRLAPIR
jgi:hypothetical protein